MSTLASRAGRCNVIVFKARDFYFRRSPFGLGGTCRLSGAHDMTADKRVPRVYVVVNLGSRLTDPHMNCQISTRGTLVISPTMGALEELERNS